MSDKLTYSGFHPDDEKYRLGEATFGLGVEYNDYSPTLPGRVLETDDAFDFKEDIAQSRFFTISLEEIKGKDGKPIVLSTGEGTWMSFLPIKNINFSYTSYDNLAVPFASLGDIPVLQRKKISTISISCYDLDDDTIEQALTAWENRCFPKNKYVAYLEDIASEMIYKSYNVKGILNYTRTFYVIPTGVVQTSRGYDVNSEKLLTFSVAAVGEKGYSPDSSGYKR